MDATEAGSGKLGVLITADGQHVPNQILLAADVGMYNVTYFGVGPVEHYISLTYNGQEIPGQCLFCVSCTMFLVDMCPLSGMPLFHVR